MMVRIVTHPESESRVPPSFRRRGESYWTSAEVPIDDEWVFVLRTAPVDKKQLDSRTLLVVTVEKLLELLVELGEDGIRSVHHLSTDHRGDGFGVKLARLVALEVAENSEDGWRRIFLAESDQGELVGETEYRQALASLVNRKRLASFPVQRCEAAGTA